MAGWAFRNPVADEPEDLRFAFINEDDGMITGNTITAQMQIGRNNDNASHRAHRRRGRRRLRRPPPVRDVVDRPDRRRSRSCCSSTSCRTRSRCSTRTAPSPSQSLGLGVVNVARNGNALRLFVNNDFGSTPSEFISVDRIAVTDTNPLTDLVTLEVNRNTGEMMLINSTGRQPGRSRVLSRFCRPAARSTPPTGKRSPPTTTATATIPSTTTTPGPSTWQTSANCPNPSTPAMAACSTNGQQVVLSMGAGPWVRSPIEDLFIELQFAGGVTRQGNVNFVGNGGKRLAVGDLNFDGLLTVADWTTFIANAETDLSGLTGPRVIPAATSTSTA